MTAIPGRHAADGVSANERPIRQGGLMRCCLATVSETTTPTKIGAVLDCKYEAPGNANLTVGPDGAWKWSKA